MNSLAVSTPNFKLLAGGLLELGSLGDALYVARNPKSQIPDPELRIPTLIS